jgi:molybdopterin converting factor small subunit
MQGLYHAAYVIDYSCPMGNKINRIPSPLTKYLRKGEIRFIIVLILPKKLSLTHSMKVELNLFASLARYAPDKTGSHSHRMLDVAEGTTILEVLNRLELPIDKIKMIFLNGMHATGDEVLRDGDRVGVFPPVAGG